jgi:hypothetical protein
MTYAHGCGLARAARQVRGHPAARSAGGRAHPSTPGLGVDAYCALRAARTASAAVRCCSVTSDLEWRHELADMSQCTVVSSSREPAPGPPSAIAACIDSAPTDVRDQTAALDVDGSDVAGHA